MVHNTCQQFPTPLDWWISATFWFYQTPQWRCQKNTISLYPDEKTYHSNGINWCFVSLQVTKCPVSHLKQHSETWLWSVWYLFGSYATLYPQCSYTAHATLSSDLPRNIPRVICNFSVYTRAFRRVAARVCTKKIQTSRRAYHGIPQESVCHTNYSAQHNQCHVHAAHYGKIECNTFEYITAFLYSDYM